jgi:hypothetical protein
MLEKENSSLMYFLQQDRRALCEMVRGHRIVVASSQALAKFQFEEEMIHEEITFARDALSSYRFTDAGSAGGQ